MGKSPPPLSKLADAYKTYPTANAAAVAALRGIDDKKSEHGGGILYNKETNTYAATDPVGQGDWSHFQASVGVPQGWTLHSTYHTHPSAPRSTQFSQDDINTAQQLKVPSYVLARQDDKVRVFDPASSKVLKDDPTSTSSVRYSNGSLVDETPPTAASTTPTLPPPSLLPSPVAAMEPPAAQAPPAADAPAATVPVAGSRITMASFAARHRAQKYKGKVVHIK